MNIQQLKEMGGFVADEPTIKTVKFNDVEFEVGILPLAYGRVEQMTKLGGEFQTRLIAETIVLADGERLTYEQAFSLTPEFAAVLLVAVNEVLAKKKPIPTIGLKSQGQSVARSRKQKAA